MKITENKIIDHSKVLHLPFCDHGDLLLSNLND